MHQNFEDKLMIYDPQADLEAKTFVIDDVLFAYFNDEDIIHKFVGKEELEPQIIPVKVGKVQTLCYTNVILIAGDKGFVVYDKDFQMIYEMTIENHINTKVVFSMMTEQGLNFIFNSKQDGTFLTDAPTEPRANPFLPLCLTEDINQGRLLRVRYSEFGNFIYACSYAKNLIRIFKRGE